MRQLNYSIQKLIKMAVLALFVVPVVLVIPMDKQIAAGHVRGVWATLFYKIGPTGRWTFAIAVIVILVFICFRSIAILFTDKVALRADETGIFFRNFWKRGQIGWDDLISIDKRVMVARGRAFQRVNIRARVGPHERAWAVQPSVLDADEGQVMDWISEARRMQANSRIPAVGQRPSAFRQGFGRKRSLIIN
jgi:hypothetical protein